MGSRSGLCRRLCCCYVIVSPNLDQGYVEGFSAVIYATCFAAMLVHLAAFSLRFDLGRWSFA